MTRQATSGHLKRPAFLLSVLLTPMLAWMGWWAFFDPGRRPIKVTGTIQAKEIPVASKVGGRIARVFVQEGQVVAPGQVLVEFDMPELVARREQLASAIAESEAHLLELKHGPRPAEIDRAKAAAAQAYANWQMLTSGYRDEEILKAQAARQEAEHALALLEQGYRPEEVKRARAQMEQARVQLEWEQKEAERFQRLSKEGAVSAHEAEQVSARLDAAREAFRAAQQEYERLLAGPRQDEIRAARERLKFARHNETQMRAGPRAQEIEMARQQYLQAKAALTLLELGTRQEQVARAQAQLNQSRAALAEVDAQLEERRVASPAEAEVSVMDLHAGQVIPANKTVATLTRLDNIWTRVYLPERELGRVKVGQEVVVRVDAYPRRQFRGKIVQIPGVAEFTPRNVQTPEERSAQVFALKITIDNKDRTLRGGMNAEVTLPPAPGIFDTLARRAP